VKRLRFSPPSAPIASAYEERKTQFQTEQYEDAIGEMEDDAEDEQSVKDVALEIADGSVESYVSEHSQNGTAYINGDLIRADYGLSQNDAKMVKELLQRQFSESQLEDYL